MITALLIGNSTFSVRVAAVPLTNKDFADAEHIDLRYPNPRQPSALWTMSDGGAVSVTLDEPLSSGAYAQLRKHVTAHPTVWLDALADPYIEAPNGAPVPAPPSDCPSYSGPTPPTTATAPPPPDCTPLPWRYSEEERYPPLPQYAGFNVFGPLNSVLFRNVTGHVPVSDQPIDLSGAPDLQLSGVAGLRNANDQELLSAPLATSIQSADLEFRAVASVRVNGVLETSWIKEHGSVIAVAGAIVAIVSLLFGIFGFLQGMRLWNPRAARD